MNDPIYYVTVNDTVLTDRIFESYDDAANFAIEQGFEEYSVLQWDVD
jgi:hypothetical protein